MLYPTELRGHAGPMRPSRQAGRHSTLQVHCGEASRRSQGGLASGLEAGRNGEAHRLTPEPLRQRREGHGAVHHGNCLRVEEGRTRARNDLRVQHLALLADAEGDADHSLDALPLRVARIALVAAKMRGDEA
jgi:hypothetical protein